MARSKFTAAVLTVSDSCAAGKRVDRSGPAVAKALATAFSAGAVEIVPDERRKIEAALRQLARRHDLVVTTGGTGIAARDVTPEATRAVCSRLLEGIPERMRLAGAKKTQFAVLSRGVCGVRGRALILNLPGSPRGAMQSLQSVLGILPHAVELLRGKTEHL